MTRAAPRAPVLSLALGLALGLGAALAACVADAPEAAPSRAVDATSQVEVDTVSEAEPDGDSLRAAVAPPRCAAAPVDLYGQAVWVDGDALWLAPHLSADDQAPRRLDVFAPDETARSPVVTVRGANAPSLFVAVRRAAGCELRVFDGHGARVGTVAADASDCQSPAVNSTVAAWPVAGGPSGEGGGRVVWIHASTLTVLAETDLGASPVGAPVIFGTAVAAGGGSHWVVGTADGAVALWDHYGSVRLDEPGLDPQTLTPPAVLGRWRETEGRPAGILAVGTTVVLPLHVGADADDADLGTHARVLDIDLDSSVLGFSAHGPLIETPGPMHAPPLLVGGCQSVAGGGSHWLCMPDALAFVAAGDGWLAAWSVPSGEALFTSTLALDWTGLAVGDGGWVAGGGSHWLPDALDGWAVAMLDPLTPGSEVLLATGSGAACVPSPLWDTAGALAAPVVSGASAGGAPDGAELVRVPAVETALAVGLGAGMSRPQGDNHNAGRRVAAPGTCADDVERSLRVSAAMGEVIRGVGVVDEQLVFWGGDASGGFVEWQTADGPRRAWSPTVPYLDRVLPQSASDVIMAWQSPMDPQFFHLAEYAGIDIPTWNHAVPSDRIALTSIVPTPVGKYIIGGATDAGDRVMRIENAGGLELDVRFLAADGPVGLVDLLPGPDHGAIMVVGDGVGLTLRQLDVDLQVTDAARYEVPGGRVTPIATTVDAAGVVRALVSSVDAAGAARTHALRYGPGLDLRDARVIDVAGPMGTAPDGASLIVTPDALVRLGPEGELGLARPFPAGLTPVRAPVAVLGEGFIVAFERGAGEAHERVWARADRAGFIGCAALGLCLGIPVPACDAAAACVRSGCEPATGTCLAEPLDDCP